MGNVGSLDIKGAASESQEDVSLSRSRNIYVSVSIVDDWKEII